MKPQETPDQELDVHITAQHELESVVFAAKKRVRTEHPAEFAPMEYMAKDDKLVCAPA